MAVVDELLFLIHQVSAEGLGVEASMFIVDGTLASVWCIQKCFALDFFLLS